MEKILDATGNPIVLGDYYGRSNSDNGFSEVRIGRATKVYEGRVTLRLEHTLRSLYSNPLKEQKMVSKFATYKAATIFPVDMEKVKWVKLLENESER